MGLALNTLVALPQHVPYQTFYRMGVLGENPSPKCSGPHQRRCQKGSCCSLILCDELGQQAAAVDVGKHLLRKRERERGG